MVHKRHSRLTTVVAASGVLALAMTVPAALTAPTALAGTASPAGTVSGIKALYAAACPTAAACVAVGFGGTDDNLGKSAAINAATGAATAWSGSLTNDPLNDVACAAGAKTCLAVADDAVASVAASNAAMKVTAVPKKPSSGIVALGEISCASAKACYAVGFEGTEASSHALIVALSGAGKITKETTDTGTGIGTIACPASTRCLLSDASSSGVSIQVLNSGKPGASSPMPAHTYVEHLSCYKSSLCYALAGNTSSPMTDELFPLNPTTGKPGSPITISGFDGGVNGLACASATVCVVAGATGTGSSSKAATVVVSNGKAEAPVHYTGLPVSTTLSGIGCASATVCYAVAPSTGDKSVVVKVSA
jgi:hypothetical protein